MKQAQIAYQIYSARKEAEQDLKQVLLQVKAMGYAGVEFAGFYGHSAQDVQEMLAQCGLSAVSSHVPLDAIAADMAGVIAYHKAIGCQYIAIPYLGKEYRPGAPGFAGVIRLIYAFGTLCRENGIQLLYHNHDFEFVPLSGMNALDFLYEAVPAALLQTELDLCWVKYAGEDPCAYLRKYAGRAPVVHFKDYTGRREGSQAPYGLLGEQETQQNAGIPFAFQPLGYGCQDIPALLEAAQAAGAQWLIVEQDESTQRPPLEAAKMSIDTLKKQGI